MAGQNGTTSAAVNYPQDLAEKPYQHDFFQAVRRLESLRPELPRLGTSARAKDDPIRLAQECSLAFAPSTLARFEPGADNGAPLLAVYFLGLLGPNGPLPLHLSEYARDRLRNSDDRSFVGFLDIFHHRMLSLFYRAWAAARPAVSFDRPQSDRYADYVGSTFGMGMGSLRDRDALPDLAKLGYAGHLSCQTRHADGLEAMLGDFFQIPVEVEEFVGHWIDLPEDSRWRLGESPETGALGMTAAIGAAVWDRQYKFRIRVGPLDLDQFRRLLPGGVSLSRLVAVVRNYLGDELVWDLNIVLKRQEAPPLALGATAQLGWTSWVTDKPLAQDADDLLLDALAYAA